VILKYGKPIKNKRTNDQLKLSNEGREKSKKTCQQAKKRVLYPDIKHLLLKSRERKMMLINKQSNKKHVRHLLEGRERSKDGSSDPDRVFPLRRSDDLDLHGGRSQRGDLLLHSVSNTRVHGGTSGEHSVGVQVLPDVHITLHDGVVGSFMDSGGFHTWEVKLDQFQCQ
jgi:hypothetical protein